MNKHNQSLLRSTIVSPKASCDAFLKTREKRLAFYKLQDQIWRELLKRIDKPIRIYHNKQCRIIEVLGTVRYYIRRDTGAIHSMIRERPGNTVAAFVSPGGLCLIDPPLLCNEFIIRAFLKSWENEIFRAGPRFTPLEQRKTSDLIGSEYLDAGRFEDTLVRSLVIALRQSVDWKRLRCRVRDALDIDPQVLDIARRARIVRHKNNLTQEHLYSVIANFDNYRQLDKEAPNLLWLYTLALEENLPLVKGEFLQAIKQLFLEAGCQERGWRLVAKHHLRDFAPALEYTGTKWRYLVEYAKLHNILDRNRPIPRKLSHLFDNPEWHIEAYGTITYRNINLAPTVLNCFIDEAARQSDIDAFLTTDATAVFIWLAEAKPKLDSNQVKLGWEWLSSEANHWLVEQAKYAQLHTVNWECGLGETDIAEYKFTPLYNAWLVRQEALRYRHCADRYINQCINGTYRLYGVYDSQGKHKATLGLKYWDAGWLVDQIKGFANKAVSPLLTDIAESLTAGLDIVDEGATVRASAVVIAESNEAEDTFLPQRQHSLNILMDADNVANHKEVESHGSCCPICKEELGTCAHLIACIDRCGGGLAAGDAGEEIDLWLKSIFDLFKKCAQQQQKETGLGREFDAIFNSICDEAATEKDAFINILKEYHLQIEHAIWTMIGEDNDVLKTVWHHDCIPMSTTYDNYWAEDTLELIQRIGEIFCAEEQLSEEAD